MGVKNSMAEHEELRSEGMADPQYLLRMVDEAAAQGLSLDHQHVDGSTLLHRCVEAGLDESVSKLLACGASTTVRNGAGKTPKDVAIDLGMQNILHLIERTEAYSQYVAFICPEDASSECSIISGADPVHPAAAENITTGSLSTLWRVSDSQLFDDYMDWNGEERLKQLNNLIKTLHAQERECQSKLELFTEMSKMHKEYLQILCNKMRDTEHKLCVEIWDLLKEEKTARTRLEKVAEDVSRMKQVLEIARTKLLWSGPALMRLGMFGMRWRQILVKLTGEMLTLHDAGRDKELKLAFRTIYLDHIVRVDEEDEQVSNKRKGMVGIYIHSDDSWLTGKKDKLLLFFPHSRGNASDSVESSYLTFVDNLKQTLVGRCAHVGVHTTPNCTNGRFPGRQHSSLDAAAVSFLSSTEFATSLRDSSFLIPRTLEKGDVLQPSPSDARGSDSSHIKTDPESVSENGMAVSCLIDNKYEVDESEPLPKSFEDRSDVLLETAELFPFSRPCPKSPCSRGSTSTSTTTSSPIWLRSSELSPGRLTGVSVRFKDDGRKDDMTLQPIPQRAGCAAHRVRRNLHFLGAYLSPTRAVPANLKMLDVGSPTAQDRHFSFKKHSLNGLSVIPSRNSSQNFRTASLTRAYSDLRISLEEPCLKIERRSSDTGLRLGRKLSRERLSSWKMDLPAASEVSLTHYPSVKNMLQQARSYRTVADQALLDVIAERECVIEQLHYVQSLRYIAEQPPARPTNNFAMVEFPRLSVLQQAQGESQQHQPQLSWSRSLHLGHPPPELQEQLRTLVAALERLWACEKDAFETVETLRQTLVQKEHTWRSLLQLQHQAQKIETPKAEDLYEVAL